MPIASYADSLLDKILRRDRERKPHRLSLENYVEVTRRYPLDPWQRDLCRRLEKAYWLANVKRFPESLFPVYHQGAPYAYVLTPSGLRINAKEFARAKNTGTRAAIHAPPRFGKSVIISQNYPAWILGFDPLHRFRLATFSILRSARFSTVVRDLLRSSEHQAFFPNPEGHLPEKRTRVVEWSTNARTNTLEADSSFAALGLQSGFTGTGADTLLMDDPYRSAEEALSEVIRDKTWRFWSDTAAVRMDAGGFASNVFIMFHRYHQDDMGGRAISSREYDFDLWRYAAQCDGVYEDDESGRKFPDPINRQEGEYLSPRFGETYYLGNQKNEQVWASQFQGRPTAKTGKMFNLAMLKKIRPRFVPEILFYVRAWDNAATQGGGAFTAGALMGIDAAENIYVFDMVREQVGTAERQWLQGETAKKDGKLVQIHQPIDPGSAGIDVAFQFEQEMTRQGFVVASDRVSGGQSKPVRAYPYSVAQSSGKVYLVLNADGTEPKWHRPYKGEMRLFPVSAYKDQIDASADGYSHLIKLFFRGLVAKTANDKNLLRRSQFVYRFGEKVPEHWEVAAAVRMAPDASKPSGYCITARAADNAHLGEIAFILASARMFVTDPLVLLEALQADLLRTCMKGVKHPSVIWLGKGSSSMLQVTAQKLDMHLVEFLDEPKAGIPEMNWYFQKYESLNPFTQKIGMSRCYALCDDAQIDKLQVVDERGFLSMRQDWANWSYTEEGDVQPWGGITLDCARMTMYRFALTATSLTPEERRIAQLPPELQPDAVRATLNTPEFVEVYLAQETALAAIRIREEKDKQDAQLNASRNPLSIGKRPVLHRHHRRMF